MKLEVNYIFHLFIVSNINMGGKEEDRWEQVNSEVLSTLQPAKMPISNNLKFQNWFADTPIL